MKPGARTLLALLSLMVFTPSRALFLLCMVKSLRLQKPSAPSLSSPMQAKMSFDFNQENKKRNSSPSLLGQTFPLGV